MSNPQQSQGAFEAAIQDFVDNLTDKDHYDFSRIKSIDDVYNETDRIQTVQGRSGTLRNLNRIQPYLRRISEYSSVIETFVQVKPDFLALLWGPIKLLLQISSTYIKSFDKLLDVTVRLADALPQFKVYEELFQKNTRINHVLCLFYKDILDFYAINLNFFRAKGWKVFFESLWPRYADKIAIVQENITRHMVLLNSEVTVADISEAFAARSSALKEYENNRKFREQQEFDSVKLSLAPRLYDIELQQTLESRCRNTCMWIFDESLFQEWSSPDKDRVPRLWLSGIPGAGKTHLAAAIIENKMKDKRNTVFAFLKYQDGGTIRRIDVYHTFIFQLLFNHESLRPALLAAYKSGYRQLTSSVAFVLSLLRNMLECVEMTYIVLDGLDEISRAERFILLRDLVDLCDTCPNVKLLLCSRKESDISRLLRNKAVSLIVDRQNTPDIECYVHSMVNEWIGTVDIDPLSSVESEVRTLVQPIAARSDGMFLYARLVMVGLMSQPDLHNFRREAYDLPNGLEEAYGRIIDRIQNTISPSERFTAQAILKWIACSKIPLRKEELQQAIMIQENDKAFDPDRKIFQDIVQLCGPIVEVQGPFIKFVHFTVKEFLCSTQSPFFIAEASTHQQLSMTCVSYLGFNALSSDLPDSSIDAFILGGSYVLFFYVEAYWLDHIKEGLRAGIRSPTVKNLCRLLGEYFAEHPISAVDDSDEKSRQLDVPDLLPLKKRWPAVYQMLCAVDYAQKKSKMQTYSTSSTQVLSQTADLRQRIQVRLESLMCSSAQHHQNCPCAVLQILYGTTIFKCNKMFCRFSRTGFPTRIQRDTHVKHHEKQYKCSHLSCDFSHIGFVSEAQRTQHLASCHRENRMTEQDESLLRGLGEHTINNMLLNAVELGKPAFVSSMLDRVKDDICQTKVDWRKVMETALRGTNVEVVEMLLTVPFEIRRRTAIEDVGCDQWIVRNPMYEAVKGGSTEMIEWFLGRDPKPPFVSSSISGYETISSGLDMMRTLLSYDSTIATSLLESLVGNRRSQLPAIEIEMAELLLEHGANINDFWLNPHCSLELAAFLIESGIDINSTKEPGARFGTTPLYQAVLINSRKGTEVAQLLLEHGADPHLRCGPKKRLAKKLTAARSFPKWLGMTFDELVESTREVRLRRHEEDICLHSQPESHMKIKKAPRGRFPKRRSTSATTLLQRRKRTSAYVDQQSLEFIDPVSPPDTTPYDSHKSSHTKRVSANDDQQSLEYIDLVSSPDTTPSDSHHSSHTNSPGHSSTMNDTLF